MLPGLEMMACPDLAVPAEVMQHVVKVESSFNPYAIGVVGGRLARQPRSLGEAVSTSRMLEREGYNFSLGIAQVNRYNLAKHGLSNYERAFDVCPNVQAGSRILAECYGRSGQDWGKAFSCYYSGNFTTGFRHGYVQKVVASWRGAAGGTGATMATAIPVIRARSTAAPAAPRVQRPVDSAAARVLRRVEEAALSRAGIDGEPYAPMVSPVPAARPSMQAQRNDAGQVPALPPATEDDAPVVVQAMGAAPIARPAPNPAGTRPANGPASGPASPPSAPAVAAPQRDAAFVF
ncbi:transglycosylase SLT domain-containing protein [Stenotrophomonas humi]